MNKTLGLLALLSSGMAFAQQPSAPPAPKPMSADECAVWERERSFARTVERHDAEAFTEHLHPGAVFIAGGDSYARGRDGVPKAWAAIIAGSNGVLYWHPRWVAIGGDPDIALSRGPYWMKNPDPKAEKPFLVGQFISTWVRGEDGQWHVLFDGGGGNQPRPATAEEVEQLKASLPAECPRA